MLDLRKPFKAILIGVISINSLGCSIKCVEKEKWGRVCYRVDEEIVEVFRTISPIYCYERAERYHSTSWLIGSGDTSVIHWHHRGVVNGFECQIRRYRCDYRMEKVKYEECYFPWEEGYPEDEDKEAPKK